MWLPFDVDGFTSLRNSIVKTSKKIFIIYTKNFIRLALDSLNFNLYKTLKPIKKGS